MTDRVYPSAAKPTTYGAAANPSFPATKSQLYGATRSSYRPQPQRKRTRRSCCCSCLLWVTLIIIILLLLIAIAGTVVYLLYRPHRPTFTVSGFRITTLNLTSNSHLATNINLNITARNPNKKLVYTYNPIAISVTTAKDGVFIGNGSIPKFVHGTKNTTLLRASITSGGVQLDDTSSGKLRSDLKSKNGVGLKVKLETKVKVKMGGIKSPKVRIRVSCEGIKAVVPTGKKPTTASVANAKCKVDVRFKIWKWVI